MRLAHFVVSVIGVTVIGLMVIPGQSAAQETGTVQGQVIDERTGQAIAAAQVHVVGTSVGGLTDGRGRYVLLRVPVGERELEVRRIGYRPRTEVVRVTAGATVDQNFQILESAVALDALVVTGTPAAIRRVEIGNALARVDAAAVREVAPVANISQMLQARTSGVRIQERSGMLGAGSVVTVRGGSSLSLSNNPIIYVDGVRVDNTARSGPGGASASSRLDDISTLDIESIEIIKGPAAATLYGTEASNGVIQVITRRGSPGATPTVNATIRQGAVWLPNPENVFEANWALLPDGTILSQNLVTEEKEAGRKVFRTGRIQSYGANVHGGVDRLSYYISGDLDDSEGYNFKNDLKRYGARANLRLSPFDNLDLEMNSGLTRGKTNYAPSLTNIEYGDPRNRTTRLRGFRAAPPEADQTVDRLSDLDRSTLSFRAGFRPTSWLSSALTLGTDVVNEINTTVFPRQPEGLDHFFGTRGLGEVTVETRRAKSSTVDFSASGRFDVNSSITSTTSLGLQYFGRREETTEAFGRELPAVGVTTVSATAVTTGSQNWVENKTVGAYVQQHVGVKDRLFLTAAVRGDDNSAFGEGFDAAIYPKVSASWLVSSEPFFRSAAGLFDQFRLRASWGQSGLQPQAFAAARLYGPITGPGNVGTLTPAAVGNPDLGPEKGEELELGADVSVLNRVELSVTVFDGRTKDAILNRSVPPSSGFAGTQFVNIGELSRRGVELELKARPITRPKLAWEVGTTFSNIRNRIEDLGGLPPIITGYRDTQAHVEGFPMGGFFGQKIIEATRDPVTGQISSFLCDGGTGPAGPFMRAGGEPVNCATAPRVYFGQAGPGKEGSVYSSLNFLRNFTLYANLAFASDVRKMSVTRSARTWVFSNSEEYAFLREGDPILQAYVQSNLRIGGLEDASFVRLREVSLSHRLDPGLLDWARTGMSAASISIAARNLKLWTKYSAASGDPETRGSDLVWGNQEEGLAPIPVQFVVTFSASR